VTCDAFASFDRHQLHDRVAAACNTYVCFFLCYRCLLCDHQNLLNANITRASALRYGDAKTLPASDVHLKPGFDAVPLRLLPGIRVSYNTGGQVCWGTGVEPSNIERLTATHADLGHTQPLLLTALHHIGGSKHRSL
jgi:hypothetical protein